MAQLRKFDIKPLNIEDINPRLLDDFSHFQKITKKYVKKNGVWEISDVSILREWSTEKRVWITKYMCQQIERGGLTAGAFLGGKLIGFCCMDGIVSGNSAKYANLTMLFVDDNWKRRGIGKLLFKEAHMHAVKLGAEKIFISAIPSIETIAFYQKIGCTDANEVVESFVDSEDDWYMEFVVNTSIVPCYCGHDCARCITYIATQNSDDHLRKQSQEYYKETLGIDVPLEKFNCKGGRSEDVFELCMACPFKKCCQINGVNACNKCQYYPCKDIAEYEIKYVNKGNQL